MIKFNFKWRNKAFQVFDMKNPVQKVEIQANNLGEAWNIFFSNHLDKDSMIDINVIEITQLK